MKNESVRLILRYAHSRSTLMSLLVSKGDNMRQQRILSTTDDLKAKRTATDESPT